MIKRQFLYLFHVINQTTKEVIIRVKYKDKQKYLTYPFKSIASCMLKLHTLKKEKATQADIKRYIDNVIPTLKTDEKASLYLSFMMYNIPYSNNLLDNSITKEDIGMVYKYSGRKMIVKDKNTLTFENIYSPDSISQSICRIFFKQYICKGHFQEEREGMNIEMNRKVESFDTYDNYKIPLNNNEPLVFNLNDRRIENIKEDRWQDFLKEDGLRMPLIYKTLSSLNVPMGQFKDEVENKIFILKMKGVL